MRRLLEEKLFPHVIKPGRYTGGEPGQVIKSPSGRVSYLHAYPDKYEIGQSYVGLQSLYHIINSDDRFLCERAFAPDSDAEELMRREKIGLFSLESSRPACQFDAIGFTLVYELVATNMLTMIDLAGIPILASERSEEHPIIMAGGPAVYNPEPYADFIDLFFIGDAEKGLPEMLSLLYDNRQSSRADKLMLLARNVESVFVPSLYDHAHKPVVTGIPVQIKARVVPELKPEYYPERPIVPLIDTVHSHLGVEIMRGCPQGCRFCQAGPMYRPVRVRSQNDILAQIEKQMQATGYESVSLMSLSSTDYPEIGRLATTVANRMETSRTSISLPALRPGSISPELLKAVSRVRKSGLTLAPEAGTERLRLFIRKDFPDEAIFDSLRIAFGQGWTTIKLYFMIGLPTETEDDLLGIARIVTRISEMGQEHPGRKTINVTLSPFVPKPHTPFQWDAIESVESILKKLSFVKRNCRVRNVHFKYSTVETTLLQGLIGRGDRSMGKVIRSAWESGARFDGWNECFDWDKWIVALDSNGMQIDELRTSIPFSTALPWSHIKKGVSSEHLQKERQRTSTLLKDFAPHATEQSESAGEPTAIFYGRGRKKRLASRSQIAPTKSRVRIQWGRGESFKYMSHLDNIRMIERILRRAHWPISYSQGFNPAMKLSYGPPLPLGFTSEAELFEATLESNLMPYMIDALRTEVPGGMTIIDARSVLARSKSLSALLNRVEYTIPASYFSDRSSVSSRLDEIMQMSTLEIERSGKDRIRKLDIRPAIYDLQLHDDLLVMTLGVGEGGYARPVEVAAAIDPTVDMRCLSFRVHRRALYRYQPDAPVAAAMEL
ncbi:MAG: TIGR03960 family B12-binding radical SAM protein [Candidatus Zixiibacteriota bacterium]